MENLAYTYDDYRRLLTIVSDIKMHDEGQKIIERFSSGQTIPYHFAPMVYLVDYTTNQYIYMNDTCFDVLGYKSSQLIEEGLDSFLSKWHPADFKIMNSSIFPQNMKFLQTLPCDRYADMVFSFNYRILNRKGEYQTLIQRSSFIPSKEVGRPIGNVGVAFDVTHFRNETSIVHTIEEIKLHNRQPVTDILYKKIYAVEDQSALLISDKEREVLKWMAEGYSSKQIAGYLRLSINTINNHRKNMLCKTGCKSSAELLKYALRRGYL